MWSREAMSHGSQPFGYARSDDIGGQADLAEEQDRPVGEVELPPAVAVGGASLVGMMIVVPAFPVGQ